MTSFGYWSCKKVATLLGNFYEGVVWLKKFISKTPHNIENDEGRHDLLVLYNFTFIISPMGSSGKDKSQLIKVSTLVTTLSGLVKILVALHTVYKYFVELAPFSCVTHDPRWRDRLPAGCCERPPQAGLKCTLRFFMRIFWPSRD